MFLRKRLRPGGLLGSVLDGPGCRQVYHSLVGGDVEASGQSVAVQGELISTEVWANLQVRVDNEPKSSHWGSLGEWGLSPLTGILRRTQLSSDQPKGKTLTRMGGVTVSHLSLARRLYFISLLLPRGVIKRRHDQFFAASTLSRDS